MTEARVAMEIAEAILKHLEDDMLIAHPEPHRWYATGTMKDGRLVKIK